MAGECNECGIMLLLAVSWEVISRDHIVAGRVSEMCKLRGCRQVPVSDDHNAFCKCAVSGHAVNDHDIGGNGMKAGGGGDCLCIMGMKKGRHFRCQMIYKKLD